MKALATLLLLLQFGPLAGPVLCHAQPTCGMPAHPMTMAMPGHGGADGAGMDHRDCSSVQICAPSVPAVTASAMRLEPTLPQDILPLAGPRTSLPLVCGRHPYLPLPEPNQV